MALASCGSNTLLREPKVSPAGKTLDQSRADCVRASKVFEKVRYWRDHFLTFGNQIGFMEHVVWKRALGRMIGFQ